jgi:predicted site-specific integrase-resolvase
MSENVTNGTLSFSSGSSIPQLLRLVDVARTLCVSPHTVRSWVRSGKIRPVRLCRRLLFHPNEVARFLLEVSAREKHPPK